MDHKLYMKAALKEAKKAVSGGNLPFGAVIISPAGKIVSKGHDTVNISYDPSSHAEISAMRKLCKKSKKTDFKGYYCYSTSEPCVMCMAACMKAGINNFYYGAPMEKDASLYIRAYHVARSYRKFKVKVVGGILEKECIRQREKIIYSSFL